MCIESRFEKFKLKANKIHNNKYNYSKFIYINNCTRSIIICNIHGEFLQKAATHLCTNGCQKCAKKYTIVDFIKKANVIHNNKYDYSKFIYTTNHVKGIIICPVHEEFEQIPNGHLNGNGCYKCSYKLKGINQKKSKETFLKQAKEIHGDKFSYFNLDKIEAKDKITIHCNTCNSDFIQEVNSHINIRTGCPNCKRNKLREFGNAFRDTVWEEKSKKSKKFDSFKVYVVKCWNATESFYKIGKTFMKLKKDLQVI